MLVAFKREGSPPGPASTRRAMASSAPLRSLLSMNHPVWGDTRLPTLFFLSPLGSEYSSCFWDLWDTESLLKPEPVHHNMMVLTLLPDEGERLEHCTNTWDLCGCMLYSMLGAIFSSFVVFSDIYKYMSRLVGSRCARADTCIET